MDQTGGRVHRLDLTKLIRWQFDPMRDPLSLHICVQNARARGSGDLGLLLRVAGGIGGSPVAHAAGVRIGLVVSPQRCHPPLWGRQVAAAVA